MFADADVFAPRKETVYFLMGSELFRGSGSLLRWGFRGPQGDPGSPSAAPAAFTKPDAAPAQVSRSSFLRTQKLHFPPDAFLTLSNII